jgi:hypothetical protein
LNLTVAFSDLTNSSSIGATLVCVFIWEPTPSFGSTENWSVLAPSDEHRRVHRRAWTPSRRLVEGSADGVFPADRTPPPVFRRVSAWIGSSSPTIALCPCIIWSHSLKRSSPDRAPSARTSAACPGIPTPVERLPCRQDWRIGQAGPDSFHSLPAGSLDRGRCLRTTIPSGACPVGLWLGIAADCEWRDPRSASRDQRVTGGLSKLCGS